MKFRVVENLEEPIMAEFLSWCRYVLFDGDLAHLYFVKNMAVIDAQKKKHSKNPDHTDDSDDDMSDVFKGTCLKFISLDLELRVWAKVKELC